MNSAINTKFSSIAFLTGSEHDYDDYDYDQTARQQDTGDAVVIYACDSLTLSIRKRLNAVKETRSDGLGLKEFHS